jgi:hypothetical protein
VVHTMLAANSASVDRRIASIATFALNSAL